MQTPKVAHELAVESAASNGPELPTTELIVRRCPVSAGYRWFATAWWIFRQQPGLWIGVFAGWVVAHAVLSMVPLLGAVAQMLLTTAILAGLAVVIHGAASGARVSFGQLDVGMFRGSSALRIVGAMWALASLAVSALSMYATAELAGTLEHQLSTLVTRGMNPGAMEGLFQSIDWRPLIATAALGLVVACFVGLTCYAPGLIVRHGVRPGTALVLSYRGFAHNLLPFLVYALVCVGLMLIAIITLGLGLIVIYPLYWMAMFVAFDDIFATAHAT